MKIKKFLVLLIGLVFVSGLVFSQTPEKNFKKTVQSELQKREEVLLEVKNEIEAFFDGKMVYKDFVINGKEMRRLRKIVKKFDNKKEKFNKELEFYNVATSTDLKPVIKEHIKIYFYKEKKEGHFKLHPSDNESQEIKLYRVKQTGRNVDVEKSTFWFLFLVYSFLIGGLTGLLGILLGIIFDLGFEIVIILFLLGFFLGFLIL